MILVLVLVVGLPTLLTFFSLLNSHPRGKVATEAIPDASKTGIKAFFSFHTPSTLFPPSAIISLTDDNSTFFLARPANFGPLLAANGLSGQLWIGSGFGGDSLGRGGAGEGAEGELGCSDVPGWEEANQQASVTKLADSDEESAKIKGRSQEGSEAETSADKSSQETHVEKEPSMGDGTDDHLHHPLPSSPVSKQLEPGQSAQHEPSKKGQPLAHADIQSLQESAEISGKVVLLSRGGCGFLEKVKWAQRRGGVALIVGDHTRGGALVTMYARGDTSNVTIPSLFTSHTTAHLLSSLIPSESLEDVEAREELIALQSANKDAQISNGDKPGFIPMSASKSNMGTQTSLKKRRASTMKRKSKVKPSWMKSLGRAFGMGRNSDLTLSEDSRRPPSSGRIDWFGEKWNSEKPKESKASSGVSKKEQNTSAPKSKETRKPGTFPSSSDDFVIGVQDWRDPDLVAAKASMSRTSTKSSTQIPPSTSIIFNKDGKDDESDIGSNSALTGGSITPGSGEYHKPGSKTESQAKNEDATMNNESGPKLEEQITSNAGYDQASGKHQKHLEDEHEGLWVTLTPTTMSSSPFFDTILVLVVSPLVTLTVVYALLLLRSRIRRRRWRAPKSVVDRLPIRTYHTMSSSSSASPTRFASQEGSSPTSPLLQSGPYPINSRSRSNPMTTSSAGSSLSVSMDQATARASSTQREKGGSSPRSRKKYSAKQVECVVCLEEYVDGHSRVMSLPCGHEFHAECMYVIFSNLLL